MAFASLVTQIFFPSLCFCRWFWELRRITGSLLLNAIGYCLCAVHVNWRSANFLFCLLVVLCHQICVRAKVTRLFLMCQRHSLFLAPLAHVDVDPFPWLPVSPSIVECPFFLAFINQIVWPCLIPLDFKYSAFGRFLIFEWFPQESHFYFALFHNQDELTGFTCVKVIFFPSWVIRNHLKVARLGLY